MSDSYVCSKAKIRCSCGDKISTLTVFPDRTIWLTGEPQANISDHIPMRNIAPFGKCHTTRYPATGAATAANHGTLTPMPCVPNTPFPWMGGKNDVLLKGDPALLKTSKCKCVYGGTITFTFDGQIDNTYSELPKENQLTQEELDREAEVQLSAEELLDGLQMVLDTAGMVPGLGALPDLLNACISACRGDWTNAGLCLFAAIPGIGDAAGATKLIKNSAKMARKSKKLQKASSGVDEVAIARAKKNAKATQERLVEQGIAEGKVTRIETKRNVIVKKEATTGGTIEINQPTSVSRFETTRASSVNPDDYKITPVAPVSSTKRIGSSTSYGAGHGNKNIKLNKKPKETKEKPILEMKEQSPKDDIIELKDIYKRKDHDAILEKKQRGEEPPKFGL